MIEVEMKAKINDKKEILEKINKIGGKYSHTEKQHDIYYNAPDKDYSETDEALRIREIPDENDFKRVLTYKGPKIDTKSKTRKEIEVLINDTDNMNEILLNLGFKPSAIVNKIRRVFDYEDYTITLDKLDKLGYYMEIEFIAKEGSNIEEIRNNIIKIFEKLGINSGFERVSYLELLQQIE